MKIEFFTAAALGLYALALTIVTPAAALGHAFLDHAEPKVGATLASSPAAVRLWFDCALEAASSITVKDLDGRVVDNRDGRVNRSDTTLLEVSTGKLPPGRYRVFWSVLARDGDRTTGDYTFRIR